MSEAPPRELLLSEYDADILASMIGGKVRYIHADIADRWKRERDASLVTLELILESCQANRGEVEIIETIQARASAAIAACEVNE